MSKGKWELEKRIDTIRNNMKAQKVRNKERDETIRDFDERIRSLERRMDKLIWPGG